MRPIKNIIFDLGGVLLDIDFTLLHQAFENLGVPDFSELYNQRKADPFFSDFEKGKILTADFFEHIRQICGCHLDDEAIRSAWNAMLIGFPPGRAEWLLHIREKYNSYLFSNTNIIHYEWFSKAFKRASGVNFNACFRQTYYSHAMGLRKPDPASFQYILDDQQLDPAETLFIDDTIKNVEAARQIGMQAIHLVAPLTVEQLSL
jgi:FMN phosphatase YigB (HAD superfamily)